MFLTATRAKTPISPFSIRRRRALRSTFRTASTSRLTSSSFTIRLIRPSLEQQPPSPLPPDRRHPRRQSLRAREPLRQSRNRLLQGRFQVASRPYLSGRDATFSPSGGFRQPETACLAFATCWAYTWFSLCYG